MVRATSPRRPPCSSTRQPDREARSTAVRPPARRRCHGRCFFLGPARPEPRPRRASRGDCRPQEDDSRTSAPTCKGVRSWVWSSAVMRRRARRGPARMRSDSPARSIRMLPLTVVVAPCLQLALGVPPGAGRLRRRPARKRAARRSGPFGRRSRHVGPTASPHGRCRLPSRRLGDRRHGEPGGRADHCRDRPAADRGLVLDVPSSSGCRPAGWRPRAGRSAKRPWGSPRRRVSRPVVRYAHAALGFLELGAERVAGGDRPSRGRDAKSRTSTASCRGPCRGCPISSRPTCVPGATGRRDTRSRPWVVRCWVGPARIPGRRTPAGRDAHRRLRHGLRRRLYLARPPAHAV